MKGLIVELPTVSVTLNIPDSIKSCLEGVNHHVLRIQKTDVSNYSVWDQMWVRKHMYTGKYKENTMSLFSQSKDDSFKADPKF